MRALPGYLALLLVCALFTSGCGALGITGGQQTLSGKIAWPGGAALPDGALIKVQLVDQLQVPVAEITYQAVGRPPIDFFLPYEPARLDRTQDYWGEVEVRDATGRPLYRGRSDQPFIAKGQVRGGMLVTVQ